MTLNPNEMTRHDKDHNGSEVQDSSRPMGNPHRKLEKALGLSVLLAWTAVFGWLLVSGDFRNYITPRLWFLLAAGFVFLVVTFVSMAGSKGGHHGLSNRKALWVRSGILILPIFYLASVHGESLGSFAFNKRNLDFLPQAPRTYSSTDAFEDDGDPVVRNINDLVWNYVQLSGRRVSTIGQVAKDSSLPDGYFMLFRFIINCCVADAQPIALFVNTDEIENYQDDDWVRVIGVMEAEEISGRTALAIRAEKLERIDKPRDIYLYMF